MYWNTTHLSQATKPEIMYASFVPGQGFVLLLSYLQIVCATTFTSSTKKCYPSIASSSVNFSYLILTTVNYNCGV